MKQMRRFRKKMEKIRTSVLKRILEEKVRLEKYVVSLNDQINI